MTRNKNYQKKQAADPKKETVKTIDIKSVGTFIISKNLKRRIDYLHKTVGATEWSGVLIYKVKSKSIKAMKDLIFVGYDVYPMDVGSQGATSFNYDSSIIDMYDKIPAAMGLNTGLIHSHHNMTSFHSGTDFNEMVDNAHHYNFYVSLVVSFDGKYACKIAFPSEITTEQSYTVKDTNGKLIKLSASSNEKDIIMSPLTVIFEEEHQMEQWFVDRVAEIKRVATNTAKPYGGTSYGSGYGSGYGYSDDYYRNTDYTNKSKLPATTGNSFDKNYGHVYSMAELFTINILTLRELSKEEIAKEKITVYSAVKDFREGDAEEYEIYVQILCENLSIIHENVYGTQSTHLEKTHIKDVLSLLTIYKHHARVQLLIELLNEYITTQLPVQ